MAMNREQKRMLQRQGEVGPDGEPIRSAAAAPGAGARPSPIAAPPPVPARGHGRAAQGGLADPVRDDQLLASSCSSRSSC